MARSRRYTQKQLIRVLTREGWARSSGGKHQVKMSKPGHRPITIPHFKGAVLPVGLGNAILKQAGLKEER